MSSNPATDAIWTHLSSDLRRFIRRRVSDDHVADDLLQETFLRIHRNIETLQETDRLAAWVYQIARNVIHDSYRRSAGTVTLGSVDVSEEERDERTEQLKGRAGAWLGALIDELPEPYREAVRLSEIEGLTQKELADRLGMSVSGAKSRVQRGRALLKEILERCCTFDLDRRGNIVDIDPRPDRTVCLDCDESGDASGGCG